MIKKSIIFQLGSKVILGFVLAIFLVLTVSIVTYISIKNLLETVENLSEPNEKLRQLNGLMADVYLLDMSKGNRTSDKDSILNEAYDRIRNRLNWLNEAADSKAEIESFQKIGLNVQELMISYAGLEEVRYRLTNRNFSQEALKSIEIKLQRQEESTRMNFFDNLKPRELFGNLDSLRKSVVDKEEFEVEEDLSSFFEDIEALNRTDLASNKQKTGSDSVLIALRGLVTELFKDEQQLRENFVNLEANLQTKNAEVFSEIQNLISNIQLSLLVDSKSQNESAYNLTYTVSFILGGLVFLGVIGSLGFIYSILKEVKKASVYNAKLREAKNYSENLAKAKQDFLANMSHEIRNPLHAIQGFQRQLEKSNLDQKQDESVKMIGFASKTLMGVVNDILDFSKLEAGKIEIEEKPFDAFNLFLSIKKFFSAKAEEKSLDFIWKIDLPKNKWLIGDELRINQILNNLLSNAIKFTNEGRIFVALSLKNDMLQILVEDTGIGMAKEQLANVYNEFNQADSSITRRFGGTGLGLSIVKKLVDLQSGQISIESKFRKGTRIKINIPVGIADADEAVNSEEVAKTYALDNLKILVVDDDRIGLKLVRLILENRGASVLTYNGGIDFRSQYSGEEFDLAFIDIQMPEVSGVQVLDLIKNRFKNRDSKILAMTANVFANEQEKLIDAGFEGILLKPFDENDIIELIGSSLNLEKNNVIKIDVFEKLNNPQESIDISDLRRFCMGDDELLQEVIKDYLEHTENDINKLREASKQLDYSQMREITHQLSSRLGQIKSDTSSLAKDIEVAIKNRDMKGVPDQIEILIPRIEEVLNLLSIELNVKS
ncbi:signal transduction histidine kinase [Belliella baltica DSM 15883]|uniref:histidine kinase n=1 Tax=Belliella baltica (strain DSM 15883 / CIP 108006 / LMG 21964 / BA134) TaxID=866536 RepID=I3ZA54_BELBD|nr:ATP-binding protein [Belliella baltica]AFL86122.1 signal transduction histidine kinase [Belliella baltica DSM 15883]